MGRDLHWYVVPRIIEHDDTKPLCYSWESQPDEYEFTEYVNTSTSKWCPKCHIFAFGFYDSPLLVAKHHIRHTYSNPIWYSRWNIHYLMMGSSMTPYMRLFDPNLLYREITPHEVEVGKRYLQSLGDPVRMIDREAYEETNEIMTFLEHWTAKSADYIVIIQDET